MLMLTYIYIIISIRVVCIIMRSGESLYNIRVRIVLHSSELRSSSYKGYRRYARSLTSV